MTIIGVDSSGHVKDPPIYMTAVRKTKRKGQIERSIHVTYQKVETYMSEAEDLNIKNWFGTISAILIFKSVVGILYSGDAINIDVDFHGKTRSHVEKCIKKLCAQTFPSDSWRRNPNVTFVPARYCMYVREADKKSKKARYGKLNIFLKDPEITRELSLLN